mgnify:CR=1 FL=1
MEKHCKTEHGDESLYLTDHVAKTTLTSRTPVTRLNSEAIIKKQILEQIQNGKKCFVKLVRLDLDWPHKMKRQKHQICLDIAIITCKNNFLIKLIEKSKFAWLIET